MVQFDIVLEVRVDFMSRVVVLGESFVVCCVVKPID